VHFAGNERRHKAQYQSPMEEAEKTIPHFHLVLAFHDVDSFLPHAILKNLYQMGRPKNVTHEHLCALTQAQHLPTAAYLFSPIGKTDVFNRSTKIGCEFYPKFDILKVKLR
jgi:hypothetical protein